MQLDRNLPGNAGRGKYALLKLRMLNKNDPTMVAAIEYLEQAGVVDWGDLGSETEFFVIRLKDRYAQEALHGYACEARSADPEWADEVTEMANRAGPANRWCKYPD